MAVIINSTENTLISGTSDDDSIYNDGENITINGGAGDDTIQNDSGSNVTIQGGYDDDLIILASFADNNVIQYNYGDGNDTIQGFNANDTLLISGSEYTRSTVGNDVISMYYRCVQEPTDPSNPEGRYRDLITTSNNSEASEYLITESYNSADIMDNGVKNVTINGGASRDSINVNNDDVTVLGGDDNDTIIGRYSNSKLSGDGNDDLISIGNEGFNTIDGGNEHSVNGGAGNDRIVVNRWRCFLVKHEKRR